MRRTRGISTRVTRSRCLPLLLLCACRAPVSTDLVAPVHDVSLGDVDTDDTHPLVDTARIDSTPPDSGGPDTSAPPPLNVVVILADDQWNDTWWAMPAVSERLLPESIVFTHAYVTAPMCCPMRASFLSGGWYPRDTGVLTNTAPMGGATAFTDVDTVATRLQMAGVATGLFGKYLNEYEYGVAPYVAPGWDRWVATAEGDGGYDEQIVVGGSDATSGAVGTFTDTGGEHLTSYLFDQALAFVDEHADEPFFVYLAPLSPHAEYAPDAEDGDLYADWSWRPPAWDEEDVTDKPSWIQERPRLDDAAAAEIDENARGMLRSLASLDRNVAALVEGLDARGVLDHTVIVYASDNGFLHGQHRLSRKGLPYEESVHVPLVVRMPGVEGHEDDRLVEANTDLAATVLALLGGTPTGQGVSLANALVDPASPGRDHVYIDNTSPGTPAWAGIVTNRFKYVEWGTGEREIYDLDADPYEMDSLHAAPPADAHPSTWHAWVDEHRALAITTATLPDAQLHVPYNVPLTHWGGVEPVTFTLAGGTLPPGLTIGAAGTVEGRPSVVGTFAFAVDAKDAGTSPFTARPQSYQATYRMTVGEEAVEAVVARTSDSTARFTLPARPGVSVQVRAAMDPSMEGPRRVTPAVVAGEDGRVTLTLPGLTRERAWFWEVRFDGVVADHGEVPRPAGP
jgi:arylsulfatase A-like enzyme